MNFLRYDPVSGLILAQGYMDKTNLDAEIGSGAATLRVSGWVDPTRYVVDVVTKLIRLKSS